MKSLLLDRMQNRTSLAKASHIMFILCKIGILKLLPFVRNHINVVQIPVPYHTRPRSQGCSKTDCQSSKTNSNLGQQNLTLYLILDYTMQFYFEYTAMCCKKGCISYSASKCLVCHCLKWNLLKVIEWKCMEDKNMFTKIL